MAIIYGMLDSEQELLRRLPNEVKNINDIYKVKKEFEKKIAKKDTGFFSNIRKWNYQRQINKFKKHDTLKFQAGAKGENEIVKKLSEFDNRFHILCGVHIELPYYVKYQDRRNLKSAQMDIVVVCPKGVFMIEVKNWSNDYLKNHNKFNPYEQTERAGRVLWITLQKKFMNIRVTNVLCSINGNMEYNRLYRTVLVSSPERIHHLLSSNSDKLNQKEIERLVDYLKHYMINRN